MLLSKHHNKSFRAFMVIAIVGVWLCQGCAAWKKKFIRQKKVTEAASAEPILVPQEYPEFSIDPERLYRLHYDMWKVWARELETALMDRSSVKRLDYIQQKLVRHATVLMGLVDEKWKPHWAVIIDRLEQAAQQWRRPTGFQPYLMRQTIRRLDTKVRETLAPSKVAGHYVATIPPELDKLL